MPYIGNPIYQSAFVTDTFSGNGSTTAFTMSVAPAGTTNVLVAISGVLQDPSTYGVVGTTITFSSAPPSGTGNISCRYLGIPVTGVTTTAYRTVTEFTATAGQTTFVPPSYEIGFINVYRNGVLLGSADYAANNGVTVVLTTGATAGDLITIESFLVSSVLNALPNIANVISSAYIVENAVTTEKIADGAVTSAKLATQTSIPMTYGSLGSGNSSIMKNRIINGAMLVDQRNSGAATANTISGYTLDRWAVYQSTTGKLIAQQNAGSVTPPTGFSNYLGVTSQSAYSIGSSDYYGIEQPIEGFNTYDLAWGTANAKTVTLSFWVRSSLTGTFGGRFQNAASDYSYPFSYSIPAANTWTQISVTVAGPTSGTWLGATNGIGLKIFLALGVGSTYSATAGSWQSGNYLSVTGATSVVGTNGATFYITGVQLEVGSSATGFEYRQYQQELALCQRYFNGNLGYVSGFAYSGTDGIYNYTYPVAMRATPTIGYLSGSTVTVDYIGGTQTSTIALANGGAYANTKGATFYTGGLSGRTTWQGLILIATNATLSAEL